MRLEVAGVYYSLQPSYQLIKDKSQIIPQFCPLHEHSLHYCLLAKLIQRGFMQPVFYTWRCSSSMSFWCFNHLKWFWWGHGKSLRQGIHLMGNPDVLQNQQLDIGPTGRSRIQIPSLRGAEYKQGWFSHTMCLEYFPFPFNK